MEKFYKYKGYKCKVLISVLNDSETPKPFKNGNFISIEKIEVTYDCDTDPQRVGINITHSVLLKSELDLTLKTNRAVVIEESEYQAMKDISEYQISHIKALYDNIEVNK